MQVKLPYVGNTTAGCAMLKYVRIVNLLDVIQVFNLFQDGYMELASMLVWFLSLNSPLPSTGGPGFVFLMLTIMANSHLVLLRSRSSV